MLEIYFVQNIEQLKVFSDTLRIKILRELNKEPKTSKMLSVLLELSPSKVNYHLTELERVGLAYVAQTKLKNGIQQKFYLPIANKISLDKVGELINPDNQPEQKNELNQSIKEIVTNSLSITSDLVQNLEVINDNFLHIAQNVLLSEDNLVILEKKLNDVYQFINEHHDPNLDTENVHINLTFIPKGEPT